MKADGYAYGEYEIMLALTDITEIIDIVEAAAEPKTGAPSASPAEPNGPMRFAPVEMYGESPWAEEPRVRRGQEVLKKTLAELSELSAFEDEAKTPAAPVRPQKAFPVEDLAWAQFQSAAWLQARHG
eukprot:Skav222531  [mRNA]  locus=scaffold2875:116708:121340:+ [translate_table: standard]